MTNQKLLPRLIQITLGITLMVSGFSLLFLEGLGMISLGLMLFIMGGIFILTLFDHTSKTLERLGFSSNS